MKVVFDVGQWVSAAISPNGYPGQLVKRWRRGQLEVLTSTAILTDLHRVMQYPRIRKRHHWSDKRIETYLEAIRLKAVFTPGQLAIEVVMDDPTDNKIVVCAVEGNADYLVSSDLHLAKLGSYQGIPVVSPRQLVEELEAL